MNVSTGVYDKITGRLRLSGHGPEADAELDAGDGEAVVYAYVDVNMDYVNLYTLLPAPRPTIQSILTSAVITSNEIDTTSLVGLPDPCTITYTGPGFEQTGEVTGGTATFTTDTLGAHTVKVVAFPYLDWEGTFNAV